MNKSAPHPIWPYAFVVCVAGMLTFSTALMLGFFGLRLDQRFFVSVGVFIALAAGSSFYVHCCLSRSASALVSDGRRRRNDLSRYLTD